MASYVIGDVHNNLSKLDLILSKISPSTTDHIYFLGDLFDRGGAEPNPVGVYFRICGLNSHVTWIRGNHDELLAEYIQQYYKTPEKKRDCLVPYHYNSFDLMKNRLTEVDLLDITDLIKKLPLQVEIEVGSKKYLLAHAMTFDPGGKNKPEELYMEGQVDIDGYLRDGVPGYVSIVGHMDTSYMSSDHFGRYPDGKGGSIWINEKDNVIMLDCGCGLPGGKLACICLDTGERFYA